MPTWASGQLIYDDTVAGAWLLLDALHRHVVDLVVMDIRMKRMDGATATKHVRRVDGPPVLVFTTFDDDATIAEVASELSISQATVKTHLGSVLPKLGLRDRAAATVFAHEYSLVGRPRSRLTRDAGPS